MAPFGAHLAVSIAILTPEHAYLCFCLCSFIKATEMAPFGAHLAVSIAMGPLWGP